jgi:TolA-binding protein
MRLAKWMSIIVIACATFGCALPQKQKNSEPKIIDSKSVLKSEHRYSERLEKEKTELELQNAILLKALAERKKTVVQTPHGQVVQQFPQFEELIFDQAKTAYQEKDIPRLTEAVRILRANQPHSKYLESMYFWLAHTQQQGQQNSKALVTYDDFIKTFPDSQYVSQAMYLKGELYEKLNLKPQAFKIYSDLKKQFPNSREKHLAEAKLKEFNTRKSQ